MANSAAHDNGSTAVLSRFAAAARYDRLPDDVVAQAKRSVLDTLGVALAGSGVGEGCDQIVSYATAHGEPGRATVWASGAQFGPLAAALVNAAHARALDYDDIIDFPQVHVAVCVVPAAFAASEIADRPVTGRAFLTAVAVGCEVQSRLAAAIASAPGDGGLPRVLSTQIFGYFSAAAACGHLLALEPAAMSSAFGLALMQAAGTEEMVVHAAESVGKCLYAGLSNQGGLQSALMARHGVPARGEPLDGPAGLFASFYDGRRDRAALTGDLGDRFVSLRRCFKMMPGTLVSHAFAEAALRLRGEHHLAPADIARVCLHVGPWGKAMCEPHAMRRQPPSASAAMNSVPFIVAKAIANGTVGLSDFDAAGRSQPDVLQLAARIEHVVDPQLAAPAGLEPGVVEVWTTRGIRYATRVDCPRGHPSRPVSFADIADKFRDSARHAARPLESWRIARIIDTVRSLEAVADIQVLAALIAGRGPPM